PTSLSGWSNSICGTPPFLETLNLTEGFAFALCLARYFCSAAHSAAVILWTAFSSVVFVLSDICASPSDLAPQLRGRTVPKSCVSLNGLEATSNPPFERIDYRR